MSRMVSETVEMVVRLKVRYEVNTDGARDHIVSQLPGLVKHLDLGGASVKHGAYGARFLSASVVKEQSE